MTIEELHDRLFEILCIIDDICEAEKVPYFLDSGTEIGAVREGDFIPWDDDADIKVLSEHYSDFRTVMKEKLPLYLKLYEPADISPEFYDFGIRIVDERYSLSDENEAHKNRIINHVGIDVFVFSKAPQSCFLRRLHVLHNKVLYGLAMGHKRTIESSRYNLTQKIAVKTLSSIGRMIPLNTIIQWKNKTTFGFNGIENSFRFPSNYSMNPKRDNQLFFPEHCYRGSTYFPLRGRLFPVPEGYDEELRKQYGDYMVPEKNTEKYIQHVH